MFCGNPFSAHFQKLKACERGSILPLFAGVLLILIVVAGAGADYTKALGYRQKVANAVDAAALTVATKLSKSVMTDAQIEQALQETFLANLSALGLEERSIASLDHTIDPTAGLLDVWSSIDVPMNFLGLGGIGPKVLKVQAATQVSYSSFDVELSLIVDVTGSMRYDMDTLKTASRGLVRILLPEEAEGEEAKVRISLVPYSEGVNAGQFANAVTDGGAGSRNCVTERDGAQKFTDVRYDYDPDRNHHTFFGAGSNQCSSDSKLIPLTSDRAKLESAISRLSATGYTAGQTGIAWGWYTLSPNWSNLWPAESDPEPYSNKKNLKFAIIMTDGDFNRHYDRVWLDEDDCEDRADDGYVTEPCQRGTAQYWYPRGSSGYWGASSSRARSTCDAMKAKNIIVYTVYFGNRPSSAGARVMQDCATTEATYFTASSAQDLISTFERIARSVQSIYLAR
ncbi:pilus assembly protein [Roseibium sediminis]|uniref:pilus assembly protein n=1 Tax=Roseibium sediminis TaxID=1775174 RepID=UPI00123E2475|nr:pilus assembly protein [Roseibium sediminis]